MNILFAHRGMSALAPENTMAAFRKCREYGLQWIECDLDILADGTIVISHDDELARCTNRSGSLYDLTLDDLQDIDAGSWFSDAYVGERIPQLSQLIALANVEGFYLNLELKSCAAGWSQTLGLIDGVIEALKDLNPNIELIISSFNVLVLYEFKRRRPQTRIACLFDRYSFQSDWLSMMEACQAECIHLEDNELTEDKIRNIRQYGYAIHVYTVNDCARANQLFNWGVHGVFTDVGHLFPQRYLKRDSV